VLERVLSKIEAEPDPNVLVSFDKADDAGVYQLSESQALVQTVDFFTPVVDEPATYGRIAAANALSDIYAMGGRPFLALSLLCFPLGSLDEESLLAIVQGGTDQMRQAGVTVIGGHSVQDREMKFGYAVTGSVHPDELMTNAGAQPGDRLLLTKPLGIGIITTGIKFGKTTAAVRDRAVEWMIRLNDFGCSLHAHGAHAATDITGYGFLGHAYEMAKASQATFLIDGEKVPVIEGTEELLEAKMLAGGLEANRRYVGDEVVWENENSSLQPILLDPQTSGGLLISVPPARMGTLCTGLKSTGTPAWEVGEVVRRREAAILVR